MDLAELGFGFSGISETIITTFHENGFPNAAPIGVGLKAHDSLKCHVHWDTDTHENLVRTGKGVVNIIFDPMIFLECALKGSNKGPGEVETKKIAVDGECGLPFLIDSHAYIPFKVDDRIGKIGSDSLGPSRRSEFILRPLSFEIIRPFPKAPVRGFYAVIEVAIGLSRNQSVDVEGYMDIMKKTLPIEQFQRIKLFLSDYHDL